MPASGGGTSVSYFFNGSYKSNGKPATYDLTQSYNCVQTCPQNPKLTSY
jgi:hypothetical protein